jgi:hypothetical protein
VKPTIALLIVGLLSACLLGCATPGQPYDDAKVAMIKKDVTTEAQLLDWFGPPRTRTMRADGTKALAWRFPSGKGHARGSSGSLAVALAPNGTVTDYSAAAGAK